MENLPSLRQLQYLQTLSRTGSFSRAAESCNVTQSTFSAGIAALENLLGQQLVNRNTRAAALTALGEDVLKIADHLITDATRIVSLARKSSETLSGPLRLGIIPTIAPYILPDLLPKLSKDWPDLDLQLHEDLSSHLLDKLNRGHLDLLILAFPFETKGCEQKILFSEEFVLASSIPDTQTVTQLELANLNLLLLEEGHCLRSHALAACRTQNPAISKTFSTTGLPTLIEMVRHGYGATLLPAMAARASTLPEGIFIRRFENPAPTRDIGLVWRKGHLRNDDIENLSSSIKDLR